MTNLIQSWPSCPLSLSCACRQEFHMKLFWPVRHKILWRCSCKNFCCLYPCPPFFLIYTKKCVYSTAGFGATATIPLPWRKDKENYKRISCGCQVLLRLQLSAILLDKTTLVSNLSIYSKAEHVLILKTGNIIPTSMSCRKSCTCAQRGVHMPPLPHKSRNPGNNLIVLNG